MNLRLCRGWEWLASLVALLVMVGAACAQTVEVRNADFEQADATGTAPEGWSYIAPRQGEGFLTLAEGRQGGHSAQVTCTRLDEPWGPGFGQTGVVSVKGDQWYEVRFWAKGRGLVKGAFVALRDTSNWENRLWKQFYVTPFWEEYRLRFFSRKELPAALSRFQFSFDSTGDLWVDDITIVETEPEKPVNLDVAGRKNLLPNSSFELGAFGWATYGADELFGEVDTSTAAEGVGSFRILLEPGKLPVYYNDFTSRLRSRASHDTLRQLPICPIGYCPVQSGRPVTFSFSAKGSREGLPIVAHLIEGSGKTTSRTFTVGTQWQRFSFAATPQEGMVFPVVGINAEPDLAFPAGLWLDALQLEVGETATPYEATFPVEVVLDTGREGNVYTLGEKVTPRLTALNASPDAQSAEVVVEVEDFFGRRAERARRSLSLQAGGNWSGDLDLGVTQPGFYRLHLTVSGEGWSTSRPIRTAVIYPFDRQYPGADGFLGINHAFVSDLYMRRAKAMGLTWVRSWFCKWQDVEPRQGAFDFDEADLQFERLRRMGLHVQLCLSDPSSEWASTAPPTVTGLTNESQSRRVWWLPRSFDDYETYVREVAGHFDGRVRHYEVFNEPGDRKGGDEGNLDMASNYTTFLTRARKAVRSVSADNLLMGAGLHYLKGIEDLGPVVRNIDILSEHRYPGLRTTALMMQDLAETHERLKAAGGDRPIWITEYGLYADDDPDPTTAESRFTIHWGTDSERLAAIYAAKHHIVALAGGVEKVFYHIGNWLFQVNREHGCCFHPFFEWGGVPRKTYVALNALAWVLPPGTQPARSYTGANDFFAFEFRHGDTVIVALWSEGGLRLHPPAALLADLNSSGAQFTDVSGARLAALPEVVTDAPIYVTATSAARAEAVRRFLEALTVQ
ncbi:MAG: beta-galactosidase [Armatimonadota bacterium]